MGFEGLGAYRQQQEALSAGNESKFYKPKNKGQKVQVRPLVELDKISQNFSEKNGAATFVTEYSNPQKYWLAIVDTRPDEGMCYGHDMVRKYGFYVQKDPDADKNQHDDKAFNWNPKKRIYLPVLLKENPDDEPRVETLQLAFYGDVAKTLISFAESSDEDGTLRSITDRWWTYSRNNGEGWGVEYSISPKDPSDDVNVEDYEVPNVREEYLTEIPYGVDGAEQAKHLQVASNSERGAAAQSVPEPTPVSAVTQAKW